MHIEIFSPGQIELLPYLKAFSRSFYLVGGTAVALHLGHGSSWLFIRTSIIPNLWNFLSRLCPIKK